MNNLKYFSIFLGLSVIAACSPQKDECLEAKMVAKGYAAKMFDIALSGAKGASAYNSVLGFPEALEDAKKKCNDPSLTLEKLINQAATIESNQVVNNKKSEIDRAPINTPPINVVPADTMREGSIIGKGRAHFHTNNDSSFQKINDLFLIPGDVFYAGKTSDDGKMIFVEYNPRGGYIVEGWISADRVQLK